MVSNSPTPEGGREQGNNQPDDTAALQLSRIKQQSSRVFFASPRLVVLKPGGNSSEAFSLHPGVNSVGRAETNDVVLHEKRRDDLPYYLSREHAQIEVSNDGTVTLRDLNSRNGVYVNGDRLPEGGSAPVVEGDRIGFGGAEYFRARISPPREMRDSTGYERRRLS